MPATVAQPDLSGVRSLSRHAASRSPAPLPWVLIFVRLLEAGIFLLPLVFVPGLERPFSTPKLWLLTGLSALGAALLVAHRGRERHALPWPWLGWLAAIGLSPAIASFVSTEAVLFMLLPLPLGWAVASGVLRAARVSGVIVAASTVQSSIAVLQYLGCDPLRWWGWMPETFPSPRMRIYGTLGNPDFVAAWLCAVLPLGISMVSSAKRTHWKTWIPILIQVAGIYATGSRVFLVAAIVLSFRQRRFEKWLLVVILAAAAVLVWSPARPLATTIQGRWHIVSAVAGHAGEVPLTGKGPGSFQRTFAWWQSDAAQRASGADAARFDGPLDHAHNDYVEFWVEYGPVGLCAFLALTGWFLAVAWRARKTSPAVQVPGTCLMVLLAIACVDFPLHRPAEWALFWLFLSMLTAASNAPESTESKGKSKCPNQFIAPPSP